MSTLLKDNRPAPAALALLALAAVAVAIGGLEHARLFHRGYAQVEVVGPLFALNAVGSAVCVLALIGNRAWLFVLMSLGISVGSLVSILISHSSSFFKFSEGGYDGAATAIVVAEAAATVLTLIGAVAMARGPMGAEATA